LGALDGHRERDDSVDLRCALGLLETPSAAGLLGDGAGDVPVEVGVAGVREAPRDDSGVQVLRGGCHPCVRLRELDGDEAVLALEA